MINVSTFAGCFALRLRSTAAVLSPTVPCSPLLRCPEVPRRLLPIGLHAISSSPCAGPQSWWLACFSTLRASCRAGLRHRRPSGLGHERLAPRSTLIRCASSGARFASAWRSASASKLSLDRHTESFELLNQKREGNPFRPRCCSSSAGAAVQPYLLGGLGWYKRSVDRSRARPTTWSQHHRIRLACRRRRRAAHRQARRHPRRLPLHIPRLRNDDDDDGHQRRRHHRPPVSPATKGRCGRWELTRVFLAS